MRFDKPPVVEVWVEFHFTPNENTKEPWSYSVAQRYLEAMKPDFNPKNRTETQTVRFEWDQRGKPREIALEKRLLRARACNEGEEEWVQVGDDLLAYNLVRKGKERDYPGYAALKEGAFRVLDKYQEIFSPVAVKEVLLHYVDIVEIPCGDEKPLELENYFKLLLPRLDRTVGGVANFHIHLVFEPADRVKRWEVSLARDPASDQDCFRLRMDWHAVSPSFSSLGRDQIAKALDEAHAHLLDCFVKTFTQQGLALFGPKEGEK